MFKKLYFWIALTPFIFSVMLALVIIFFLSLLPPKLPLFYSLPWGEGQLATHQQILIIPASISLITLLNLFVSWQLHPSQSFFKRILLLSSIIITLILCTTLIKIVLNFI